MSYYELLMLKALALLIFLLVAVKALVLFFRCRRQCMPSELWHALRPDAIRRKWRMLPPILLVALLLVLIQVQESRTNGSVSLVLTYPEASGGLNPNGTRFNASEMLSEQVLNAAVQDGGLSISPEVLQSALTIHPVGQSSSEDGAFVATQYMLSFAGNAQTGNMEAARALTAVANAYRSWFIDTYGPNLSVLDISFDGLADYDYPDMEKYFSNAIRRICNLSNAFSIKNGSFISETTGMSFQALNAKGWDIYETGMEGLNAYVLANGLSRDGATLSRVRFDYTTQGNSYKNSMQSYDVRIEAIHKYDNDMATVVYIPTYDTDNTFYMSKTKIGIDHFSADANEFSSAASQILATMLDEKYLMNQIRNSVSGSEQYEKADQMAEALKTQITELAELTKQTIRDYEAKSANGYVSILSSGAGFAAEASSVLRWTLLFMLLSYFNRAMANLERKVFIRKAVKDYE